MQSNADENQESSCHGRNVRNRWRISRMRNTKASQQEKMRKHTCLPIRHIQKGSITMRCGRDTFLVYMILGRAVNSKLMGFRIQSTENSQTKKRQRNGSPMMYETPKERVVEPMSMAVLMPTLGCMDMVSC